ncbi:DUF58 domain-containing protein [Aurantimonas endophytica]|uniref:Uncharacterized protein (DUF58 family) n=1 Tax=Aurantimonas endophytica TaxID=1522175 RepID=A0A7W6MNM0_9HYPH|nr:DUF58 domain-containing protein [Aurantimonas endophytica]MBB4002015.1 uncharacterized protein (DUF58 family) [Aurantimonas endophytica]MCO6402352.1 DUF58 domain-containing protein [Aurantimonas endophytica]
MSRILPQAANAGAEVDADELFRLRLLVRHIPERGLAPTGRPGGFAGKRRGNGLEIVDVRPFSEGDDIRHVDAAATARTGRTHVRTFRDEREKTALLVADFRPSMLWGTSGRLRSVAAATALALAGWRVIEAGGRVGVFAIGAGAPLYVAPRGRERGMAAVAGGLARAHAGAMEAAAAGRRSDPALSTALEGAVSLVPRDGTLFLATGLDEPGAAFDPLVAALRRRARLVALLVRDRFETAPPRGAYPYLTGAGSTLRWAFVTGRGRSAATPDPRLERLGRLGAEVRVVDADADSEAMAQSLAELSKGFDAGRS